MAAKTKAVKATSPLRTSPRKTRPSRKKTEAEETTYVSPPSKVIKTKVSPAKTKTTIKSNASNTSKASPAKKGAQRDDVIAHAQSNGAGAEPQKPVRGTKKSGTTRTQKTSPVRKKSIGEVAYRPEIDENEDDQDEIEGTRKTKKNATKGSGVVTSPPKKRGRPRKNPEAVAGEEVSSPPKIKTRRLADKAAGVAEASPPKKRGRPRKEPSNEAASAENTETLPKRRGRPPNNVSATISAAKEKDTGGEKTSAPRLKDRVQPKTTKQRPTSQSPPKSTKAATTSKTSSRTTRSVSPAKGRPQSATDQNPPLNRAAVTGAYKYLGLPPRKAWSLSDTAIATAYRDRLFEEGVQKDELREALGAIAYARGSAPLTRVVRDNHETASVQRLLARSPSRARSASPAKKKGVLSRERAGSGSEGLGMGRKRESSVALGEEWTDSPAKKARKGSAGGGVAQSYGISGGRNFSVGGVKQSIESAGGRSGSSSPGRKRTSKSMSPTRRTRGSEQPSEKSRSVSPTRRAVVPRMGSVSARASPSRGRSKSPGTEAPKASSRARSESAGAGKWYGDLDGSSIPSLSTSVRSPSRASRRSPSPRRQNPNAELAPQSKTRSPQAPVNASQSTKETRRSPSKSPARKTAANPPPPPPPNSRTVSGTASSERVQIIPQGQPSGKDREPVHSSTNPQFIPNDPKQRPNPFFETMPAAEIWHQRMPSFFPFGETPYLERVKSQQIEEDLAYG